MSGTGRMRLTFALVFAGLVAAACGGRSSRAFLEGAAAGSGGAAGSVAGSGPQLSGGSSAVEPTAGTAMAGFNSSPPNSSCEPMDARPNGNACGGDAGYAFDGKLCVPIGCGCEGSDCHALFPTVDACDRAHEACYEAVGVERGCTEHRDCRLQLRACCVEQCQSPLDPTAPWWLGTRTDSVSLSEAGICRGRACGSCDVSVALTSYAVCIEGRCSVYGAEPHAVCQADADCRVVTKDCCSCGGDYSESGVMAVNRSFTRPEHCDGVGCDDCFEQAPAHYVAQCDLEHGHCVLVVP